MIKELPTRRAIRLIGDRLIWRSRQWLEWSEILEEAMTQHAIVDSETWIEARKVLLNEEKALTKAREALAKKRRQLPWTPVAKPYEFEGEGGAAPWVTCLGTIASSLFSILCLDLTGRRDVRPVLLWRMDTANCSPILVRATSQWWRSHGRPCPNFSPTESEWDGIFHGYLRWAAISISISTSHLKTRSAKMA